MVRTPDEPVQRPTGNLLLGHHLCVGRTVGGRHEGDPERSALLGAQRWWRLLSYEVLGGFADSGLYEVLDLGRARGRGRRDADRRLEAKVMQLKKMSDDTEQAVTVERTAREADVRRLDQRITDEAAAIRAGISAREEAARRGDASVLPVLGLGVVLTAIPDVLAHATWLGSPVLAGVLGIVAGLAALQGGLMHFWRSARQVETV